MIRAICLFTLLYASSTLFATGEPLKPKIRLYWYVASAKKFCEAGIGICVGLEHAGRAGEGRNVAADCFVEGRVMHLFILKQYVSPQLKAELESNPYFVIEENQDVPENWLSQLELKEPLLFVAGRYPVMDESDHYLVQLSLK